MTPNLFTVNKFRYMNIPSLYLDPGIQKNGHLYTFDLPIN